MKNTIEYTPLTDWWLLECPIGHWLLDMDWPRWLRRAYLVSLPISLPVHLVLIVVAAAGILVTLPIDFARTAARLWH